jgi:hypothetical protein
MPTADEPSLGQTPARTISSSEFEAAFDLLGVVDPVRRDELRGAVMMEARRYLRWTKQEGVTPPLSRQKVQLAKVKDAAGRLIAEVEKLVANPDAEFAFISELQRLSCDAEIFNTTGLATSIKIDDVRNVIAWLRDGASDTSGFLVDRSGPKSRPSLDLFVFSLCRLYEQITGKPATHNPYIKIDYEGTPQSAAGRFVQAIVGTVDPKVTPMQISTAMVHVGPELRRSRTNT